MTVEAQAASRLARGVRALWSRKLALLAIWYVAIKFLSTLVFASPDDTIFDISFGFGPFVESLDRWGDYRSCVDGTCTWSTRMPGLPLFFAAIGLISHNLLVAALLKTLIMTIGLLLGFRYLFRQHEGVASTKSWVWFVVAGVLAFSPSVVKHATSVHYEEGFLVEILFLWAFAFLLTVRRLADSPSRPDHGVLILALALSCLAYIFKSSMITVLGLTLLVAAAWFVRWHSRKVLAAALVCLACVGAWGVRNQVTTDHFSVLTSFDGQNAYRGANDQAAQLYPDVDLDRLFGPKVAYPVDGNPVPLPSQPLMSSFADEWAQDNYYKSAASDWIFDNPGEAANFTVKKAWNFFVSVRNSPYTRTADARDLKVGPEEVLVTGWLTMGRVLELAMIGLLVALWRRRDRGARLLVGGVLAVNAAYAAPYVIGFNYERHVTTYLVIVAACVGVLLVELRGRKNDVPRDPAPVGESAPL